MGKKTEPLSESYYYILLCLAKGVNHGYGIMQMTETLSGGEVRVCGAVGLDRDDNMTVFRCDAVVLATG